MADEFPQGNRVLTGAPDTPVSSAKWNQWQDEVIHALEARRWNHTPAFHADNAGSWVRAYTAAGNLEYYMATGAAPNAEQMSAEIILPVDAKIIDIDVIYQDSSRNGGEIALYKQQLMAVGNAAAPSVATAKLFDLGASAPNPFNQGGANWYRVRTTVNEVIAEGYRYYVSVISSTTGAGGSENFYTLLVNAQFSTG